MLAECKTSSKIIARFYPSFWVRILGRVPWRWTSASISSTALVITRGGETQCLSFRDLKHVDRVQGWPWAQLVLVMNTGNEYVLGGITKSTSLKIHGMIIAAMRSYQAQAAAFAAAIPEIKAIFDSIQTLLAGTWYISQSMKEQALAGLVAIQHWLDIEDEISGMTHDLAAIMQSLQDFRLQHETLCANANEHFINAELERYSGFFDTVEKNPLTQLQRRAVVIHDDNTLVVAGAGAGKTSVILAKTGYLLKKNLVSPGTILLLAYNANAARQMSDRIRERLGVDVTASTFHSLGLSIITKVEGRKPSVSVLSDDEWKLQQFIQECIGGLVEQETYRAVVFDYFQEFFAPYKSPFDFQELGEYYQYVKTNELRTLLGDLCKSYEECEISNYLYLNGIEYEYERPYPVDLSTVDHRQYTPDFYLPTLDIYLEHLAIREDGTTPKFIDQQRYLESVEWKRQVHKQHGTILWETYTYQKANGTLIKSLESRLREHGAEFRPLPAGEALQALNKQGKVSNLSRLIAEFLRHYKGGCLSLTDLRNRTAKKGVTERRFQAFLGIFEPVYERYQEQLHSKGELDFEDMIAKAARYAEEGRYASPYQCILVDEFQDISRGRSRLIQALLGQQTGRKLFCVGDDWQAIYRFAGSDISLMREFSAEFGSGTTVVLDKTFRFNNQIENTASRFIMKNPGQIKKSLDTVEKVEGARVFIHWTQKENTSVLRKVVMNIAQDWQTKNIGRLGTVMLLGRYRCEKIDIHGIKGNHSSLSFEFSTIHKAKGLEADYVIILGMRSGLFGFPSEMESDSLLDVILADKETFPYAEERRLFYVALSRARHAVHVIADQTAPSSFVSEISRKEYGASILGQEDGTILCPLCGTGHLITRTSRYGAFYGCTNYPLCEYATTNCPKCGTGLMRLDNTKKAYICTNLQCRYAEMICPKCHHGRLIERRGIYGAFLGCSMLPSTGCDYTRKL